MTHTKKTLMAGVTATALVAALTVTSVASADDQTPRSPGCVTYAEYKKAKTGMTVKQVAQLFGTKGKQSSKSSSFGITIEIRSYDGCNQFSVVSVLYTNGRLDTKSQAGL